MNPITLLAILVLSVNALYSETLEIDLTAVELPNRVIDAEEKMIADLAKAHADYTEEIAKVKSQTLRIIERERDRERDTIVAAAIQIKMDEIKSFSPGTASDIVAADIADKIREEALADPNSIIGTWKVNAPKWSGVWTFKIDGTVIQDGDNRKRTWEVRGDKIAVINHSKNREDIIDKPKNNKTVGTRWNNKPLYLKK